MELLFMEPIFKETIWGGSRLKDDFGYEIPSETTGECWGISAHENGNCKIRKGSFSGLTLGELWKSNRELFGDLEGDKFPLLVKIIDAKDDLSIQVHPDDSYGAVHENGSFGKTECWYILDCEEDAHIVIGHHAKDKEEARKMVSEGRFDDFIRKIPVHKGDFFQIDPGCIHAICRGTLLLETQQNSDITYRVYDYGRLSDGKPRELHIEKSLDVTTAPFKPVGAMMEKEKGMGYQTTLLYSCQYYKVFKTDLDGSAVFQMNEPFLNVSVIEGKGSIDGTFIKKGDHFIIPAGYGSYSVEGKLSWISSHV